MNRRLPTRTLAALLATAALASAWAASSPARAATLPAGTTALLSGGPSLFDAFPVPVGYSQSTSESTSQDGRYVAFTSTSDGLSDADDDRVENVFVKDRVTGAVSFASRATGAGGAPARDRCDDPAISDDGSRVAFTCDGPLDAADTNGVDDVYIRDLSSSATYLVSRAGNLGAVGNQSSRMPSLSATGEYVAFSSDARNLDPDAADGGQSVYRRRIGSGDQTLLVSRADSAQGAHRLGYEASISDDGNRIAFTNVDLQAPDPVADTNSEPDVYVRTVSTGATILVSRKSGATGAVGNGASGHPAIAGNGNAVAFESEATSFDHDNDSDAEPDIYWRSLTSNTTTLVSINAAGDKGQRSTAPAIDDSGNVVGFVSEATALDPADTGASADTYVKNLATNALEVASRADGTAGAVANANAQAVSVSGDGTKAASAVGRGITADVDRNVGGVFLRDLSASPRRTFAIARPAGDAAFQNQGGYASAPSLSADGRFAAFVSSSPALGLPAGALEAAFVRDRVTGSVTLASRADGPAGAPFTDHISRVVISADGNRVALAVRGEGGEHGDIWVRDLAAGRTVLASRADGAAGVPGNGLSSDAAIDADGSRIAFTTTATNLGDGDTDTVRDVHLRDLATGRTVLVSRADGPAGAKGNAASSVGDIDAGGDRITLNTSATNLGDGDTDTLFDVHLRDLSVGTTRLVSATPGGVKANAGAGGGSLDATGTRVVFSTPATNLGVAGTAYKVFVRDLAAGRLDLASPADTSSGQGVISPDGGYVAFESGPGNDIQIYRRDLAAATTELVSRRSGAGGAVAARQSRTPDITVDGACVGFSTADGLVGPPLDAGQAYLRAVRADCAPRGVTADATGGGGAGGGDVPVAGPARPGGAGRDTIAPVISGARLSRTRFRISARATALAAAVRRGTTLSFRSSEAGTLSIGIERRAKAKRTKRTRGKARIAYRRAGVLTRRVAQGSGRVPLTGRLGKRRLAAGRYRLVLTARDAAGNRSKALRLTFSIVKG